MCKDLLKFIRIDAKIYPYYFCVLLATKPLRNWKKLLKPYKLKLDDYSKINDARGWAMSAQGYGIIILNSWHFKNNIDFLSTLRHEVHHACADCFEYICEPINTLDNETFLYLNDYVFEKCLKKLTNIKSIKPILQLQ